MIKERSTELDTFEERYKGKEVQLTGPKGIEECSKRYRRRREKAQRSVKSQFNRPKNSP